MFGAWHENANDDYDATDAVNSHWEGKWGDTLNINQYCDCWCFTSLYVFTCSFGWWTDTHTHTNTYVVYMQLNWFILGAIFTLPMYNHYHLIYCCFLFWWKILIHIILLIFSIASSQPFSLIVVVVDLVFFSSLL